MNRFGEAWLSAVPSITSWNTGFSPEVDGCESLSRLFFWGD
jgi:hypothetical protein